MNFYQILIKKSINFKIKKVNAKLTRDRCNFPS